MSEMYVVVDGSASFSSHPSLYWKSYREVNEKTRNPESIIQSLLLQSNQLLKET